MERHQRQQRHEKRLASVHALLFDSPPSLCLSLSAAHMIVAIALPHSLASSLQFSCSLPTYLPPILFLSLSPPPTSRSRSLPPLPLPLSVFVDWLQIKSAARMKPGESGSSKCCEVSLKNIERQLYCIYLSIYMCRLVCGLKIYVHMYRSQV